MNRLKNFKVILVIVIILLATIIYLKNFCFNNYNKEIDISQIKLQIDLVRIDKKLFDILDKSNQKTLKTNIIKKLNDHNEFTKKFLGIYDFQKQNKIIDELIRIIKDPYQRKIIHESEEIFKDLNNLKLEITKAFKYIKYYYPDFTPPKIFIFTTGLSTDIYIDKGLIVLDLSYFFGKNSKFAPSMPEYILNTYSPQTIISKMIILLSKQFNKYNINDSTLLSEMIYYGKSYIFAKYILPKVSFKDMFGYNKTQMKYLKKNKRIIWEYFINNKFLYNKIKETKSQFIDEAPFTFEFGKESPGKIGRWFGKEIIESYIKNNKKITLKELMDNSDSQFIFTNSRYIP